MSSGILHHGLERASAALHYLRKGTCRHFKAANVRLAFTLSGVLPSIITYDVRQYQ